MDSLSIKEMTRRAVLAEGPLPALPVDTSTALGDAAAVAHATDPPKPQPAPPTPTKPVGERALDTWRNVRKAATHPATLPVAVFVVMFVLLAAAGPGFVCVQKKDSDGTFRRRRSLSRIMIFTILYTVLIALIPLAYRHRQSLANGWEQCRIFLDGLGAEKELS